MTVEQTLDFLKSRIEALGHEMTLVLIRGGQFTNYADARAVPSNNSKSRGTVITVSLPDRDLYYLRGWDIEFNVPLKGKPGVTGRPDNIKKFFGECSQGERDD